jgi:hypothetical protein
LLGGIEIHVISLNSVTAQQSVDMRQCEPMPHSMRVDK